MKSFHDYLGLSNSCSYDVDDVIGQADRFGFQNFCNPGWGYSVSQTHFLVMVKFNEMKILKLLVGLSHSITFLQYFK